MRDDYKLKDPIHSVEVQVEKCVFEKITKMTQFTGLSLSEITNTALKRFVSQHQDFLPPKGRDNAKLTG